MADPSHLVLLQQLPALEPGTKVRFLGCVHDYDMSNAQILLCNQYPATAANISAVAVNLAGVLEGLSGDSVQKGSWLNVIGTIRSGHFDATGLSIFSDNHMTKVPPSSSVVIDATMLWSAGAVKLEKYEAAVRAFQVPLNQS